jgi:hypothetical protein
MITHTFDYGWGPELLTKQLEAEILRSYLKPFQDDESLTVIVNNTWYSDWAHEKTVQGLREIRPDRIVLVAMIDAANCQPDRFSELAREVRCVGYYGEPDNIDFWALAVDRWLQVPDRDLLDPSIIDTAYMCLNRKPHWHRQQLYDALIESGVVDQGLVSMGSKVDGEPAQRTLALDNGRSDLNLNPNPGVEQTGIVNDIMSLGHPDNWSRIFLDVVTETQFNLRKTRFVSEKIYKPIVGLRPFLVYARDGAVPWLMSRGFEPYINDFQDITDLDLSSYHNTVPFLKILCAQPPAYWQKRMVDLRPKILYNRNRFDRYVQEIKDKIHKGIQCQI